MKKQLITCLTVLTLSMASSMSVLAVPEVMPDGGVFDTEYYAQNNPDVVQAIGTDKNALYYHYVNYGKTEGRLPFDESQVDFATKATQKLTFNANELIEIRDLPVTIDELKADMRPHAGSYSLKAKQFEEYEIYDQEVTKVNIYDIPLANYIYCCEFDKYVAEKALLGYTLDTNKTSIKMSYHHYIQPLTNVYTSITSDTEIAVYEIYGSLAFTTKEGLTVERAFMLRNENGENLEITKEKEGYSKEIYVYHMRDYNGERVMDNANYDSMTYLEFAKLIEEGKVTMYSGKSYGLHMAPLGGYTEINEEVTNKAVYVE